MQIPNSPPGANIPDHTSQWSSLIQILALFSRLLLSITTSRITATYCAKLVHKNLLRRQHIGQSDRPNEHEGAGSCIR